MKIVICLTALVAAASAISCPSLSVVEDFDISRYTGVWYKQYSLNTPWEIGTCAKATYTYDNSTGVIGVENTLKTIFGGTQQTVGSAVFNYSTSVAKFDLTLASYFGDITAPMWVLSTDYDNYAVVYTCSEVKFAFVSLPYESVWVVTRDRSLSVSTEILIQTAMKSVSADGGPSFAMLSAASQKNC